MLPDSERTRLRHIVEAGHEAIEHLRDQGLDDLKANRLLQHALVRCIEILGEAAAQLTPEFRDAHPEVPWLDMIGMGNRVVHAYFDIDLEIVWHTVADDLPSLIREVETLLRGPKSH
jgi:uncharacterized protein with HEPN domain